MAAPRVCAGWRGTQSQPWNTPEFTCIHPNNQQSKQAAAAVHIICHRACPSWQPSAVTDELTVTAWWRVNEVKGVHAAGQQASNTLAGKRRDDNYTSQ